jgi:hypothetical protein
MTEHVFKPGQVWRYAAREHEEQSRVHILRIDSNRTVGDIVHIAISGVRIERSDASSAYITNISHVPVSPQALESSDLSLESELEEIPDFEEGYRIWREAFDSGDAGIFSIPVAEIVDVMEQTMRLGS